MGRGVSRDRLPDDAAQRVRDAVRKARDIKGVTNAQISGALGWGGDPRRVVDMLATGRPLRERNAKALLFTLLVMKPQRAAATRVLRKAAMAARIRQSPPVPIVLIHKDDVGELARLLASEIAAIRKLGFGIKKREALTNDLRLALKRTRSDMAGAFLRFSYVVGAPDRNVGEMVRKKILPACGYDDDEEAPKSGN